MEIRANIWKGCQAFFGLTFFASTERPWTPTPPLNILIYLVYLPTDGHTGKQPDRLLTRQQTERDKDRQRVRKCKHITDKKKGRQTSDSLTDRSCRTDRQTPFIYAPWNLTNGKCDVVGKQRGKKDGKPSNVLIVCNDKNVISRNVFKSSLYNSRLIL